MDEYETEYFDCQCYSDEHTLKFSLTEFGEDGMELSACVYLHQFHGFFSRVWLAIKYVFGYHCKDGHFDCFLMRNEDATRLIKFLERYREQK